MDAPEGVKFVLMVNKQGHTRFSKWMQHVEDDPHRRRMMEYELVRKCMPRDVDHVRFYAAFSLLHFVSIHPRPSPGDSDVRNRLSTDCF
jgi:hypothetical protein